jgi:hypothetical protein
MRSLMLVKLLPPRLLLAPATGGLAQQTPTPAPLVAPPGPVTHSATRFDVPGRLVELGDRERT